MFNQATGTVKILKISDRSLDFQPRILQFNHVPFLKTYSNSEPSKEHSNFEQEKGDGRNTETVPTMTWNKSNMVFNAVHET
jgi:hypothetical protein